MLITRGKIIDKCVGCAKVEGDECKTFLFPDSRWRNNSNCPIATHVKREAVENKFQNPLKASKQKMKKR